MSLLRDIGGAITHVASDLGVPGAGVANDLIGDNSAGSANANTNTPGTIPGQPSGLQVAAALKLATPAELTALQTAAQTGGAWCAVKTGDTWTSCVSASQLLNDPDLLAFHAWGGASGTVIGHEIALHNALQTILKNHPIGDAPVTSSVSQNTNPSVISQVWDRLKTDAAALPERAAEAVTTEVSRAVTDATKPAVSAVTARKVNDYLPAVFIGAAIVGVVLLIRKL